MKTKKKQQTFRACFGRLGELRSLAPSETPVITATATSETRRKIIKGLSLKGNLQSIIASPNIYLYVAKVDNDLSQTFGWLITKLRKEKQCFHF